MDEILRKGKKKTSKNPVPELLFLNLLGDAVGDKSRRGLALEWNSVSSEGEPSG